MDNDLSFDGLMPLAEAARTIPGQPHLATVYRWVRHGVGDVRLEAVKVGGRLFTSQEAVDRFIRATSTPPSCAPGIGRSVADQTTAEAAGRLLDATALASRRSTR